MQITFPCYGLQNYKSISNNKHNTFYRYCPVVLKPIFKEALTTIVNKASMLRNPYLLLILPGSWLPASRMALRPVTSALLPLSGFAILTGGGMSGRHIGRSSQSYFQVTYLG